MKFVSPGNKGRDLLSGFDTASNQPFNLNIHTLHSVDFQLKLHPRTVGKSCPALLIVWLELQTP